MIYAGGLIYIGSSKDLGARLRKWSCKFPGAKFAVYPCDDYRQREQQYISRLRASTLRVANCVNAIRPLRERKPRTRKPHPPKKPVAPPRVITANGATRTLTEWCRINGIYKSLFYARLRAGWTEQEAIKPSGKKAHT